MESSAPFVVYPPESDPKITLESLSDPLLVKQKLSDFKKKILQEIF